MTYPKGVRFWYQRPIGPTLLIGSLMVLSFQISTWRCNDKSVMTHNAHRLGTYNERKNLFTPHSCTLDEVNRIVHDFGSGEGISVSTRCPVETWLHKYYKELYKNETVKEHFLGISLGCNKGDDAIDVMRMGSQNQKFDSVTWRSTMFEVSDGQSFSGERACPVNPSDFPIIQPHFIRDAKMHCVEAMPSTFKLLNASMYNLGLEKEGFVVQNIALGSTSGIAFFPDALPGRESLGLSNCNGDQSTVGGVECKQVLLRTLDKYVFEYVGEDEWPIDILSIDTEGFDFDVLYGSTSTLEKTQYLIFEYHETGTWSRHSIKEVMDLLQNADFTCYWAGEGKLWRIHDCWQRGEMDQLYSWHGWSNIACVKRSNLRLAEIMEDIFLETIE